MLWMNCLGEYVRMTSDEMKLLCDHNCLERDMFGRLFHIWPFRPVPYTCCTIVSSLPLNMLASIKLASARKSSWILQHFVSACLFTVVTSRVSFTSVLINLTICVLLLPGLNLEMRIHTPGEPQDLTSLLSPEP